MQAVCMKVVTSSSVDSPKIFWEGQILWLKASNGILFGHCLSKHKMTKYVRNLGGMVPLPSWLRLWLQEKNEKERTVLSWCSIFHWQKARNNARQLDTAEPRQKAVLSVLDAAFGCYQLDCPQTEIVCWNSAPMLGKSARTVSRVFYLEKRVYVGLTLYG